MYLLFAPFHFSEDILSCKMDLADDENEVESAFKRAMPWLADDFALKDVQNALFPGLSLVQWMAMQQNPQMLQLLPLLYSLNT